METASNTSNNKKNNNVTRNGSEHSNKSSTNDQSTYGKSRDQTNDVGSVLPVQYCPPSNSWIISIL